MGKFPQQFDTRVKRIHELMGDGDDVRSWPGTVGQVHLATARDDVRDALHRPEFERSDFMAQVCGKGLIFSDGDEWRERRRLAQPLFHERVMSRYRLDMTAVLDGLTKRLDLFAKSGEPIDLLGEMVRFTVGTLYRTLFGITLPSDHDRGELLTRFFNAIGEVTLTVAAPGAKIPTEALKRLRESLSEIDCEVKDILDTHATTETADDDLISTLQASLSEDELRDELVTFFVAGGETTANLLSWLLLLLTSHPNERARVEAELDALSFETAEPSLLQTAPTLNAAVRETMRLYPPVWLIARQATKDTQLGDRAVKARDWVLVCTYLVQRNPKEWSDPHAFCPNRFAQAEEEPPRYTYLPFGEGRHLCLGKHFGEIEATLAAATMLKRYRLEFLDDIPLAPAPGLTLKPRDSAQMRVTFR